ncbi:hypothetical protein BU15DRAFT_70733 [Melanogaster broomeanus]|nr:hypothetical protein BU15DRAFT_70733 [Melanogaster broomeanus]
MHDEAARFPRDPVMLIVCPTKALELDMERKMRHAKLNAVAVNADTVDDARKKGINIFNTIQAGVTMVLLSPEQLKSRGFWNVLEAKDFCFTSCIQTDRVAACPDCDTSGLAGDDCYTGERGTHQTCV